MFNTARYVGVAAAELSQPLRRWHVRLAANVVGPYSPFDAPGLVLSAYALIHASAGLIFAHLGLIEVGICNALNRAYPELRAGSFVAPGQPRSAYATLRTEL